MFSVLLLTVLGSPLELAAEYPLAFLLDEHSVIFSNFQFCFRNVFEKILQYVTIVFALR